MKVTHPLKPIYNEHSKVLLLGTMPSIKSREEGFYYAHPKNRFWKIMSQIYAEEIGNTKQEKIDFLLRHHIALFDVLKSCDMVSSEDNSIKNPIPNDLTAILKNSGISAIFTTGTKAYQLYQKYCYPKTHIPAILLPSTSPANCKKGIEEILYKEYQQIKQYTK